MSPKLEDVRQVSSQTLPPMLKADEVPALFWDDMPEDPNNPDLLAIQAINEESTPEERALSFKVIPSRTYFISSDIYPLLFDNGGVSMQMAFTNRPLCRPKATMPSE